VKQGLVCVQRATTAASRATSSATVPTQACRPPTAARATIAAKQATWHATARTSRLTIGSATTVERSVTFRGTVRREVVAERQQGRTMTAPPATSESLLVRTDGFPHLFVHANYGFRSQWSNGSTLACCARGPRFELRCGQKFVFSQ